MVLVLCNTADLTMYSTDTDCYVRYYCVIYITQKREMRHQGSEHQSFYLYILTHLGPRRHVCDSELVFFFNFLAMFEPL